MKQQLEAWSREFVPRFNLLSQKHKVPYYTQSPLDTLCGSVDEMLIGINPQGKETGKTTILRPEEFLHGNPCWEERFCEELCCGQYFTGVRFFMGYDRRRHPHSFDNDQKVVWTNLTPFASNKGFTDLPPELRKAGIESLLRLIQIVRPQRIVLLGGNAFRMLEKYSSHEAQKEISHEQVFRNQPFEIGRIYGIPAVYVCHPSSPRWAVKGSRYFIPMFLHQMIDTPDQDHALRHIEQVCALIRHEVKCWQEQIITESFE